MHSASPREDDGNGHIRAKKGQGRSDGYLRHNLPLSLHEESSEILKYNVLVVILGHQDTVL